MAAMSFSLFTNNNAVTSYIPPLEHDHLCDTQSSFHVTTHHAPASVNAWLLKTKALRNVMLRTMVLYCTKAPMHLPPLSWTYFGTYGPTYRRNLPPASRHIGTHLPTNRRNILPPSSWPFGTYLPTFSGSAQWLRAAISKGSTRLGAFRAWRQKQNRLPKRHTSLKHYTAYTVKKKDHVSKTQLCMSHFFIQWVLQFPPSPMAQQPLVGQDLLITRTPLDEWSGRWRERENTQ